MAFISARDSAHLKATVLALKAAPREIRSDARKQTRQLAEPIWREAMRARPATVQQSRMLVNTARVAVSGMTIAVRAAGSKRKVLSGGATPVEHGMAFEFGTKRKPGRFPRYRKSGYVFFPTLAEVAPRIISLWVQTSIRVVARSLEGKR